MIRISQLLTGIFIFFLISTGIYLVIINISLTNSNVSQTSQTDLDNLNLYQNNNSNPFLNSDNSSLSVNYSLTSYSNTGEFEQSNIETKGAMESILEIFGNNRLTAFKSPITFLFNFSPLPNIAFNWATNMVLSFIGIALFVAIIAAWKAGVW